jgi:outer membrane receptor protein involved in Fe transport
MAQYRFQFGPTWSGDVWSSASWVTGNIVNGSVERDLSYIADYKIKLGATLRYLDHITISPQVLWIGDTNNGRKGSSTPDYLTTTPGYTVANLHIGWHKLLGSKTTAWLDINNLFDKRYFAAHGAGSRTFFDMPQQPRTWTLSLEYPF